MTGAIWVVILPRGRVTVVTALLGAIFQQEVPKLMTVGIAKEADIKIGLEKDLARPVQLVALIQVLDNEVSMHVRIKANDFIVLVFILHHWLNR